jgi:hypothetical protein
MGCLQLCGEASDFSADVVSVGLKRATQFIKLLISHRHDGYLPNHPTFFSTNLHHYLQQRFSFVTAS